MLVTVAPASDSGSSSEKIGNAGRSGGARAQKLFGGSADPRKKASATRARPRRRAFCSDDLETEIEQEAERCGKSARAAHAAVGVGTACLALALLNREPASRNGPNTQFTKPESNHRPLVRTLSSNSISLRGAAVPPIGLGSSEKLTCSIRTAAGPRRLP